MTDLARVFADLRGIMLPYARKLDCKVDSDDELYVDTKHIQENKKPLWFGGIQIKTCGHVGCCDSSPNRHATKHFQATHHPIVQSLEPGEDSRWCYIDQIAV